MKKQLKGAPSGKSSVNSSTGGSSYYTSLIESKDLEIKRLTQIVISYISSLVDLA